MSEGKDIAVADGREMANGITASQRLTLIREALTNPDVSPEKAGQMLDLMAKMEDRQARADFIAAKVAAISDMPHIGKDGENTHTGVRYATWERMQPAITPVLMRHGLILTFKVGHEGNRVAITPILSGHGWQEEGGAVILPSDEGKGRSNVQAVGSSISYGKRYAAMAMLNLIQKGLVEDDDGRAAGGETPERKLTPDQQALVEAGRSAAMNGTATYDEWFKGLPTAQKGWLIVEDHHAKNKQTAEKVG